MQVLVLLAFLASQQHNIDIPRPHPVLTQLTINMTQPISADAVIPEGPRPAYLTFDDGPSNLTRDILAVLEQYDVKATFFVNGPYLKPDPALYQEMIDAGHVLANHTYTHKYSKLYSSTEAFLADVDQLDNFLQDNYGYTTRVFRFPGGSNNTVSRKYGGKAIMPTVRQAIVERGYNYFDWNISAGSSDAPPSKIAANILTQAREKRRAFILMHDHWNKPNTMKALPSIIEGLRNQGYEFQVLEVTMEPMRYQ